MTARGDRSRLTEATRAQLGASRRTWRKPYWGLMLAFGILETLFSFWLLARPGLTLVAAVLALGLWSLIYGVVQIVISFEAKNLSARADSVDRELTEVPQRSFGTSAGG
jgi:uncharacterized membrane protein HdeD (DUF308 family)